MKNSYRVEWLMEYFMEETKKRGNCALIYMVICIENNDALTYIKEEIDQAEILNFFSFSFIIRQMWK